MLPDDLDYLTIREGLAAGGLERERALARLGAWMYTSSMMICNLPDVSHWLAWNITRAVRERWEKNESTAR